MLKGFTNPASLRTTAQQDFADFLTTRASLLHKESFIEHTSLSRNKGKAVSYSAWLVQVCWQFDICLHPPDGLILQTGENV